MRADLFGAVRPRGIGGALAVSLSAALVIVLTGCVPQAPVAISPSPSASSSAPDVTSQLLPVFDGALTAAVAESETTRVADALVSFVDPAILVNDDVHSLEQDSTLSDGKTFALVHTMTLDPTVDPAALARLMVGDLRESGWIVRDTTNADGIYLVPLVSASDPAASWFIAVGSDSTIAGQPVVSLQLVSPDYRPAA